MVRIILKSDSGSEIREYKFPDDLAIPLNNILSELLQIYWKTNTQESHS